MAAKKRKTKPTADTVLNKWWRPLAAYVYLLICVCDFIIFPWYFGLKGPTVMQIAMAIKDLDPAVGSVLAAPRSQWQPLTLMGGGMFHVAFGAILGVAAWTRGAEKVEEIRSNAYQEYDYTDYSGRGAERGWRDDYDGGRRPRRRYQDPYMPEQYEGEQLPPTTDEVDNPDLT